MSEQEGPSKKQRISRACDRCRRRKSKCDGKQPICTICEVTQSQCSYSQATRKRGLPTGYVRSLETALGLMLDGCSEAESKARLLVRSHQSSGTAFEDAAVETWRKSGLAQDMALLLSDPDELLDDDEDPSDHATTLPLTDARETGNMELDVSNGDRNTESLEISVRNPQSRQPETLYSISKPQSLDILNIPLPVDTSDLLDFYFAYTHSWFPIVERSEILRAFHTKRASDNPHASEVGHNLCLCAIIAFSSINRGGSRSGIIYPQSEDIQAQILSRIAINSQNIELGHAQAPLVIVLSHIGIGNLDAAWILVVQVVRTMSVINERQTTTPARFNHVFNGCIYLDNFVSALLGKVPYMSTFDQSELGEVDESGIEEWDTWAPLPQFPSEYSRVISRRPIRALSTFNTLRRPMRILTYVLQAKSTGIRPQKFAKDTHDWQANLEEHHRLNTASSLNPSVLFLHLIKEFVVLTSLRWAEFCDPEMTHLYHSTTASAMDLMEQYIKLTGVPGSSPLLMGLALQMQSCLHNPRLLMDDTTRHTFETHINELLNTFKHHWHLNYTVHRQQASVLRQYSSIDNHMHTSTTSSTPWHRERSSNTEIIPTERSRPAASGTNTIVNNQAAPRNILEPIKESQSRPFHQGQPRSGNESAVDPATDKGDDNNFDALFEEMMAFTTVRRPAQDLSFAQNMGFLDDQFDQDFLDSLNNAAILTESTESAMNVGSDHPS